MNLKTQYERLPFNLETVAWIEGQAVSLEERVYMAALMYCRQGFYLLPIVKGGKSIPPLKYHVNYGNATKKESTIHKWFNPTDGKFKGWNIGIACGKEDGVFVIDVDRHGKDNGAEQLQKLEEEFEPLPGTPKQQTPNAGEHYFFRWQDNCASSTGKIASAIDTRGGTDKACKGHVVVWPSIVEGGEYKWNEAGDPAFVPEWVLNKMGVSWRKPSFMPDGDRGNEGVEDFDKEKKIPEDQIKRMLGEINPDETTYDQWLNVGQAINTQYPGEDGLAIWDEWSKQGERYKQGECHVRWKGFDPMGPVRMGTLFYHAKQANWVPTEDDITTDPMGEIIEKMNQHHAITLIGGKIKVIREKLINPDPYSPHYDLMGKEDFRTLLMNEKVVVADDKGRPKRVSVADIWLSSEARRTYPNGIQLMPGKRVMDGYYNSWNGFSCGSRDGDCSLFLDHIENIICSGNKEHYNYVIDWMADAIQDPANPKGVAIVMRGEEGAGKGTFADTFGRLFGHHYRHLIDDSHLVGNFNAHMMDALVVFADEVTWGGNVKSSGKLKGMVTERHLIGERKGVDAVSYRNMIHMLIASNNEWVVPAGSKSRRWFVLDVADTEILNPDYYKAIYDQLENGGREALLHFLQNREIKSNLARAPETKALQDQRNQSNSNDSVLQWWITCIEKQIIDAPNMGSMDEIEGTSWISLVNRVELHESYEKWCGTKTNMNPVSSGVFYSRMRTLGLRDVRPNVPGRKTRPRAFEIPDVEKATDILKEVENVEL